MKTTNRSGHYYTNQLWFSEAYQELTLSARDLLQMLICELRYSYGKTKDGKQKVWTNNGQVSCTEAQYRKRTDKCSGTYLKARNQLITFGFIKQTHRGGMGAGSRAKYEVLVSANGVTASNERWREYPEKNWENEIPKAKKQLVGVYTRWKKGECGRKL